jgi:hypothetical protein
MLLSRDKINHLSKLITEKLERDEAVDLTAEPNDIRLQIVRVITDELKIEDLVDAEVRKILNSYSKKLREGSNEWEILYRKHYEEEIKKRRAF